MSLRSNLDFDFPIFGSNAMKKTLAMSHRMRARFTGDRSWSASLIATNAIPHITLSTMSPE